MLVNWYFLALGLCAAAVFVLAAAIWLQLRVLGRISAVDRQLMEYQTAVEQLDVRITREVKARAGLSRAEDVKDERDVLRQAQDTLAQDPPSVVALERPKRIYRR